MVENMTPEELEAEKERLQQLVKDLHEQAGEILALPYEY